MFGATSVAARSVSSQRKDKIGNMASKEKRSSFTNGIHQLSDSRAQWEREAQFDRTGRIRRYLDLAEHIFAADEGDHYDTA